MEGKERLQKEGDGSRLLGCRFNKQGLLWGLSWVGTRWIELHTTAHLQNLKSFVIEALTGLSHIYYADGLNSTFSQGCILENGLHCKNSGQNVHSMDKEGDEEPPIAKVQLMGQPAVISSQRPPPTNTVYTQNEYLCTHYPAKESTLYILRCLLFSPHILISPNSYQVFTNALPQVAFVTYFH